MQTAVLDHLTEEILAPTSLSAPGTKIPSGSRPRSKHEEPLEGAGESKLSKHYARRGGDGPQGSSGVSPSSPRQQSSSWVPRVYTASEQELVDLVGGLSWTGVR